jgi:uncharacterized membrane protein
MPPTLTILLLWVAFAATHMIPASVRLRPKLVGRLGEQGYLGLYSLVSLATFVPLVWVYFANKHAGPVLWSAPTSDIVLWILYVVNGAAFVLLVSAFAQPSPAGMAARGSEARGALLITRHPLFMAIAIWAAVHLVGNGSTSDIVFFGGMLVYSLVGARHQDQRKLEVGPPEYREFHAATPFLPFSGPRTLEGLRQLSPIAVVIGIVLTIALRWFHSPLFGP